MGAAIGFRSGRIPVEQQNETFQPTRQQDMRGAFGSECRPDGNAVKAHRGERRFDPFGEAKNSGRGSKLHGAATRPSKHQPRIRQITRF